MFNRKTVIALLFLVGLYGIVISAQSDGPISTNLKLVATVDGKSFFGDRSVMRNWTDAGKYCESLGMRFAEVTSKAQDDALKAAYGPDFITGYWTAGRDAHLPRQFSWNSTGEAISTEYPEIKERPEGLKYQTCLVYWSLPNQESALFPTPCSSGDGVLCTT